MKLWKSDERKVSLVSVPVASNSYVQETLCFPASARAFWVYSWTYTEDRMRACREVGEWEKEGRKIRKEGWLSDYSPLYMGAAGERGKGWNLLMAAIQPLPLLSPPSTTSPPPPTVRLSFAISILAILMSTDECYPYGGHPSSNRILNYPRRYTDRTWLVCARACRM